MPEVKAGVEEPETLAARAETLAETLTVFRAELAQDQFAPAMGKFREAGNLSRAWKELRKSVIQAGAEEAIRLLPRNWRVAEGILAETLEIDSDYCAPPDLLDRIRAAQREELISNAVYDLDRIEFFSSGSKARQRAESLLIRYPDDKRLMASLRAVEVRLKKNARKAKPPLSISVPKTLKESSSALVSKFSMSDEAFEKLKSTVTLVAATAMIAVSATLVWSHFHYRAALSQAAARRADAPETKAAGAAAKAREVTSKPQSTASPSEDTVTVSVAAPARDEKAWRTIRESENPEEIKQFLDTFPNSPHALRARLRLSALQWEHVDKNDRQALRAYVMQNPGAVYAIQARELLQNLRGKTAGIAADDDAWSTVDLGNRAAVSDYLERFPHGKHRIDAERRLAELNSKN